MSTTPVEIIGRTSSHYTRVVRIFAHELGVAYTLIPVPDLLAVDEAAYVGNPARKLPTLRRDGALLFGAENICRALTEHAGTERRIVWPESLRTDLARNAQELVWHAMAAQVQFVFGTVVNKLPADNPFFVKGKAGFMGALRWLDEHMTAVLAALPAPRDLSLFEVTLFCLAEHLTFRASLPVSDYPQIDAFARAFAKRPAAVETAYRFDAPPA